MFFLTKNMIEDLKSYNPHPSPEKREDILGDAFRAAQRFDNGYRKQELLKAIKEGDAEAMAEHVRYLDNGTARYTIEQAAKKLKGPGT